MKKEVNVVNLSRSFGRPRKPVSPYLPPKPEEYYERTKWVEMNEGQTLEDFLRGLPEGIPYNEMRWMEGYDDDDRIFL